ncbi:MAG: hypothetical protein DSY31_02450 [Alphaproteobacteria bacterium]|nr:MAG: hypothetical protein DSY31_02450 [Alphaproteobacteria bacterium]
MVSGALYPESKKILSLILKPLYFISGIFFSISDLPPQYVDIMTLNPILNLVEMVRDSLFYGFDSQFVDFYHATITTLVFLFISLYVYNRNKIKIHMS